jgi:hypothetical protein
MLLVVMVAEKGQAVQATLIIQGIKVKETDGLHPQVAEQEQEQAVLE